MRYELIITFVSKKLKDTQPIIESFKTKKEALIYKPLIDETVYCAALTDKVTGKMDTWK